MKADRLIARDDSHHEPALAQPMMESSADVGEAENMRGFSDSIPALEASQTEPYCLAMPMWKDAIQHRLRSARMRRFAAHFALTPDTHILDVGGTPENWLLLPSDQRPRVTLLNVPAAPWFDVPDGMSYVQGSGLALPYGNAGVDIVYSNSVIEHVETWENQQTFAGEVRRVARRYYVQTPYRWFSVEPHLLPEPGLAPRPLVHWLPRGWQRPPLVPHWYHEIRLLSVREMRTLFPGATLWHERVLGWVKSLAAVHLTA